MNYDSNLEHKLLQCIEVKKMELIEELIRGDDTSHDNKIRGYLNALKDFIAMINVSRKKIIQEEL